MKAVEQQQPNSMDSSDSVTAGSEYAYRPLTTKHRRAGSTGTTGDEEYTTDEDEMYPDEADCAGSGHHQPNPILKSDLARAATDLFGYSKAEDNEEPTSLFDEDDGASPPGSHNGPPAHYLYNDPPFCRKVLQANGAQTSCDLITESQHLDLNKDPKVCDFLHRPISSASAEPVPPQNSYDAIPMSLASGNSPQAADPTPEAKDHAIAKLQEDLKIAHEELKLKDEEVSRLLRFRQEVETGLEELTASLFQEAHNMVREANTRQATAERLLEESRMKVEVLAAEVIALKTLVLTSTPAQPNPHLHPQIDSRCAVRCKSSSSADESTGGLFTKKHRRSPSHMNLKYGRESSPPESPIKEQRTTECNRIVTRSNGLGDCGRQKESPTERDSRDGDNSQNPDSDRVSTADPMDLSLEIDPRLQSEFLAWKAKPSLSQKDAFVGRVFREDIDLCLDFPNSGLGARVREAVLDGVISIEAIGDKGKLGSPRCALLEVTRCCQHRMRLGDHENQWHTISQVCRNRITAVCDFLNYLRYVERGLVKSSVQDVYWEIARLRKEMVLARLGLSLSL